MIHTKNGRQTRPIASPPPDRPAAIASVGVEGRRMEQEVEQWIRKHPILGVSIALAAGVGLGILLKRQM